MAKKRSLCKLFLSLAIFVLILSGVVRGQSASPQIVGIPDDWSHHHVVYSNPGTLEQAEAKGELEKWLKVTSDPRYQLQQVKRTLAGRRSALAPEIERWREQSEEPAAFSNAHGKPKQTTTKDWSMALRGFASLTGTVGSLSPSSLTASSTVTVDGVTFEASPPTAASATATFTAEPTAGQTFAITNGTNIATLTAAASTGGTGTVTFSTEPNGGDTITVGTIQYVWHMTCGFETYCITRVGNTTTDATNLANAIEGSCGGAACAANPSATATSATNVTTITNTTSSAITFTKSSSAYTLSPATGTIAAPTGANACTLEFGTTYTGTFTLNSTVSTQATNLADAIAACPAGMGVTATSTGSSGVVTIDSTALGTGANGVIALTSTLANCTLSAGTLGGATNGVTSGTSTPPTFAYWTGSTYVSSSTLAATLASAVNANTTLQGATGVSSTASGADIIHTARTAGTAANSYAASEANFSGITWEGSTSANLSGGEAPTTGLQNAEWFPLTYFYSATAGQCDNVAPQADFVAFNTGLAGSATQPTIIAYDNLYSGCPTTSVPVPNVYWQYNTGTGETISTSPVVSMDGTQVAFVQTNGTAAELVILKWAKNSALTQLTSTSSYNDCTAPCMITIAFADGHNDTTSSPFYDYGNDVIYVGDSAVSSYLHKFSPVFNGTGGTEPAEVTTSPWPVLISGSNPLASPLLNPVTEEVYVGPTGLASCGTSDNCGENFHEVSTTTGAVVTNTHSYNAADNTGQNDSPIADPVAGYVYVFTPDDGAASPSAAVWQFSATNFTNAAVEAKIGLGVDSNNQFSGTFDNLYFAGTGTTGNLYVCGRATGSSDSTIWQIPITLSTNAMGTPHAGPVLTTGTTNCSPVTEYDNGAIDYIFLSVQNEASSGVGCTAGSGCIISFNVTTGATMTSSTAANSATAEAGGTGGLVIDNAFSSPSGEGNAYFFPLAAQSCPGNSTSAGAGIGICGIQVLQSNVAE